MRKLWRVVDDKGKAYYVAAPSWSALLAWMAAKNLTARECAEIGEVEVWQ